MNKNMYNRFIVSKLAILSVISFMSCGKKDALNNNSTNNEHHKIQTKTETICKQLYAANTNNIQTVNKACTLTNVETENIVNTNIPNSKTSDNIIKNEKSSDFTSILLNKVNTVFMLNDDNNIISETEKQQETIKTIEELLNELKNNKEAYNILSGKGTIADNIKFDALASIVRYPNLSKFIKTFFFNKDIHNELEQLLKAAMYEISRFSNDQEIVKFKSQILLFKNILSTEINNCDNPENQKYISVKRDNRKIFVPFGNILGIVNTIYKPFTDNNKDGYADIDDNNNFILNDIISIDKPFLTKNYTDILTRNKCGMSIYKYDNNEYPLYKYTGINKESLHIFLKNLSNNLELGKENSNNITLLLEGLTTLIGDKQIIEKEYKQLEKIHKSQFSIYNPFSSKSAPLFDIIYSLGLLAGTTNSNQILIWLQEIYHKHEQDINNFFYLFSSSLEKATSLNNLASSKARLNLNFKKSEELLNDLGQWFDTVAAVPASAIKGEYLPNQDCDINNPTLRVGCRWYVKKPRGLLEDIIYALTQSDLEVLGKVSQKLLNNKDILSYNTNLREFDTYNWLKNLQNLSDKSQISPHIIVNRDSVINTSFADGKNKNRSAFEKLLQTVISTKNVTLCNKENAQILLSEQDAFLRFGLNLLTSNGSFKECEIFKIDDLAKFYIQAMVNRASLEFKDSLIKFFADNAIIERAAEIKGFTLNPTFSAINRLLFFGTPIKNQSDYDPTSAGINRQTSDFINGLINPVPTNLCSQNQYGLRKCLSFSQTMRGSADKILFYLELENLVTALSPLINTFIDYGREDLLLDFISILNKHWPSINSDFCHENTCGAGLASYENFFIEFLSPEILSSLKQIISNSTKINISINNQQFDGINIASSFIKIFMSPKIAKHYDFKNRNHNDKFIVPAQIILNSLLNIGTNLREKLGEQKSLQIISLLSKQLKTFLPNKNMLTNLPFSTKNILHYLINYIHFLCPNIKTEQKACLTISEQSIAGLSEIIASPLFSSTIDLIQKNNNLTKEFENYGTYLFNNPENINIYLVLIDVLENL